MLRTWAPGSAARIAVTARAVSASPASTTVPALAVAPYTDSTSDSADGTALISDPRHGPAPPLSASASRSATISTDPPLTSGVNSSKTETSKLSDVEASTRDSSPAVNSDVAQASRLATQRCSMTTPLGRPVDPDV